MKSVVYKDMYEHEMTHWWYRVRRNLVKNLITTYSQNKKDNQILDIGCGTGALMKEIASGGTVTGVDFSADAVHFCKQRGLENVVQGSVTSLPFLNDTFDIVLALDILEHVEDDGQAVQEISRVLKPGGVAIIFVPAFMVLWGSTDEVSEHKRRYRKKQLLEVLKPSFFKIERISYFNFLLFTPILLLRALARLLRITFVDEYKPGTGFLNKILYTIFIFEIRVLRYVSFPFGVSIMALCRKKYS